MKTSFKNLRNLGELFSEIKLSEGSSEKEQERLKTAAVVEEYVPFIRFIARKFLHKVPGALEIDELVSCGVIGLIDAMKKFNPERMNKFKTYAEFRIRGAILDELRGLDVVPRSIRDKRKEFQCVEKKLADELGRKPNDEEVAKELGISMERFGLFMDSIKQITMVSYEDLAYGEYKRGTSSGDNERHSLSKENSISSQSNSSQQVTSELSFGSGQVSTLHSSSSDDVQNASMAINPFVIVQTRMTHQKLQQALEILPELEQSILNFYYFEGLKLKEIAQKLKITSTKVSQIRAQAVSKLKELLYQDQISKEDILTSDEAEIAA